jgi:hypothetical protein
MWYLPGLLIPARVVRYATPIQNPLFLLTCGQGEFNRAMKCLKKQLCKTVKDSSSSSSSSSSNWRDQNYLYDPKEAKFGVGRLSLSVGKLLPGHQVCILAVYS